MQIFFDFIELFIIINMSQEKEEVKSYAEIKSDQKARKRVQQGLTVDVLKVRSNNASIARDKRLDNIKKEKEEKEAQKQLDKETQLKQLQLLEEIKKKYDTDDDSEEDVRTKRKVKAQPPVDDSIKYIIETLRNIEKKTEKMYLLKKSKFKPQHQPLVISQGYPNPQNQGSLSRSDYLQKMYSATNKKI